MFSLFHGVEFDLNTVVALYKVKVLCTRFFLLKKKKKNLLKQNFNISIRVQTDRKEIRKKPTEMQLHCRDTVSKLQKNSSCFPIAQILVADVLSHIAA